MTKSEFLEKLKSGLHGLPDKELQSSLEYYGEMIDERIESGLSEEEAISQLGDPETVAREILLDLPLPTLIKQNYKRKSPWTAWEIVLLVLGSPLWLSLGLTAVALVFTLYALLWVVVAVLWTVDIAVGVAGLAGFLSAFPLLLSSFPNALFNFGLGILCAGVAVLGFFGCLALTKLFYKLSIRILKQIKSMIIRRNQRDE